MSMPKIFLEEADEFHEWCKKENVTSDEALKLIFSMLRCFHAIRFPQMKDELIGIRRYYKEKTPEHATEELEKAQKKEEEKQDRITTEIKAIEDENKPIPLNASADEAMAIRRGDRIEVKSIKED